MSKAFDSPAECSFPNPDIHCRGFHSTRVWSESFLRNFGTICIAAVDSLTCRLGLRLCEWQT